ncbi:MFS transporter [Tengunoibacter tsumagoiensis]|uniref:MFS transporter n=1 Tax=Tengunoibacter tsumagoiensis TaxID=2014871 RepID=A0A402A3R6_9CHLR|nr:MFS transporter [Tengunoibacter tsumagoiensis]GCE13675.1 hypothetical protein KTT_35340 [Tengunoibacter tsumagoiensis]
MKDSLCEATTSSIQVHQPWRRWLATFFCHTSLMRLLFTSAIWMIYLKQHGYSPFTIGLLEMTFHVAKFAAEVPTGIFADLLGRRRSLMMYCLLSAIDTLVYLHPTLPLLFCGFALSGISYAFLGGASDAILWTLTGHATSETPERHTTLYSRFFSLSLMFSIVFEMLGTSLGGYLGTMMEVLPFLCRGVVCLLAIIPLLLLPVQVTDPQQERHDHPNPLTHLLAGLKIVWQSPQLLGLICISGLTESCGTTIYFFVQLQFHDAGFSLSSVGIIMALASLSQFGFTALAPYLLRRIRGKVLLPICFLAQLSGLLLMIVPQSTLNLSGFLVLFQASTAILYPTISTKINERAPEKQRATVLSFETGLFSLAMIVLFPLFGLGLTSSTYSSVYSWTAVALTSGGLITYLVVQARTRWLAQPPLA